MVWCNKIWCKAVLHDQVEYKSVGWYKVPCSIEQCNKVQYDEVWCTKVQSYQEWYNKVQ